MAGISCLGSSSNPYQATGATPPVTTNLLDLDDLQRVAREDDVDAARHILSSYCNHCPSNDDVRNIEQALTIAVALGSKQMVEILTTRYKSAPHIEIEGLAEMVIQAIEKGSWEIAEFLLAGET